MFARLLSMTALVSTRFETPAVASPAGIPDVTDWLVPESVGRPLPAGDTPREDRGDELDDEEVTEEFLFDQTWSRTGPAVAEA